MLRPQSVLHEVRLPTGMRFSRPPKNRAKPSSRHIRRALRPSRRPSPTGLASRAAWRRLRSRSRLCCTSFLALTVPTPSPPSRRPITSTTPRATPRVRLTATAAASRTAVVSRGRCDRLRRRGSRRWRAPTPSCAPCTRRSSTRCARCLSRRSRYADRLSSSQRCSPSPTAPRRYLPQRPRGRSCSSSRRESISSRGSSSCGRATWRAAPPSSPSSQNSGQACWTTSPRIRWLSVGAGAATHATRRYSKLRGRKRVRSADVALESSPPAPGPRQSQRQSPRPRAREASRSR
mmetsp:Transcript_3919/g.8417  ORF Transcript_3919/g.8417 Transcript_3919/m.8417 type:complete len:291 (-) Transcript_3919:317-1189(-)